MQTNIYVSWPKSELMVRLVPWNMFKISSNVLLTVPRRCFFYGHFLIFTFHVFVFVMLSCLFLAALWSPAEIWLTSWFSCVLCFHVFLSLSHIMSRVRCGTWLYRLPFNYDWKVCIMDWWTAYTFSVLKGIGWCKNVAASIRFGMKRERIHQQWSGK